MGLTQVRAVLLTGTVLFSACARPEAPPGGPRDMVPPMIASTVPDTFAVIEATRDPVKILFSERISERPTQGSLDNAVIVSPFTGTHRVKHTRSGLEIEVIGGFKPNLVYRIRILPTVKDLFNNPMEGPFELVFSTGAAYETNVIAGMVKDRISGEAVAGVRVEAREQGVDDPPVYIAVSDSVGVFALRYLPSGSYDVSLYQDVNRNAEMNFAELQGDTVAHLGVRAPLSDTVLFREVALLRPDTSPARLVRVEAMDSVVVRLAFDDFLDAEASLDPVQVRIAPEEGSGPAVDRLVWPRQRDSLRAVADSVAAAERQAAMVDSLSLVADSLEEVLGGMEAAGDTLGVDSVQARLEGIRNRIAPPEAPVRPGQPDPRQPPAPAVPPPVLPQQEFFVLLTEALTANQPYRVTITGLANINGLGGGGGEGTFTWEPPEPAPGEGRDTAAVAPDTSGVPPDTSALPPDTSGAPPDTSGLPPGLSGNAPDPGREGAARIGAPIPPWWPIRRSP
jgi:hypothetical protein